MSETISLALGERAYDIHVGAGLLARAGGLLAPMARNTVAVVTDETVAGLHLETLVGSLRAHGIEAKSIVLRPGEQSKSFGCLETLCRDLLQNGVERNGLIIAFGGGVIGDVAGFAAGIVKRGVDFVQIPTTLLAQVDSSVGGKTGIDTPEGKNLVGLFHQPKMVIADTALLSTLPERELRAGYAEVVKYGALGDAGFFAWLEENGAKALAGDAASRSHIVAHSCRMKAAIVGRDEREAGERALLNLGHTFGHALEAASGYAGALLHGEAVAAGMALAFRLSERLGYCSADETRRLIRHLAHAGLPAGIGDIPGPRAAPDRLLEIMRHDKKVQAGRLKFVLVRGIGNAFVADDVPLEAVRSVLSA